MGTTEVTPTISSAELSAAGTSEVKPDPVLQRQQRSHAYPRTNVRVRIVLQKDLPNPRPAQVLFGGLADPDLRLVRPVPLDVSVEESTIVVNWAEVDEFGSGATLGEALEDFASGLRDLYHQLFAPDANLGTDLQRIKRTIEQYIQPRK